MGEITTQEKIMEEYTQDYYQAINKEEKTQAKELAKILTKLYSPKSVIDIGCGTGLYLAPFKCTKCGFDISENAFLPEVRQVNRDIVTVFDLRTPYEPPEECEVMLDLGICLEVLEHIGSEYADIVVENIVKFAPILVVTASPPGQAGLNHVNCQPQKYWDEKFKKHGFMRDYHDEFQIIYALDKVQHTTWIVRNLMVYKKI